MAQTMTAVVTIDKAGRIVIPKDTRESQGIRPGAKFLLVEGRDGRMWLQRLDAEALAESIQRELRGVNLDPLIQKVEGEIEELARERYSTHLRH